VFLVFPVFRVFLLSVRKLRNAIHRAYDQPTGIQHMLRPELLLGPSIAGVELNSEKVADIPIDAVADLSHEVSFFVKHPYLGLKRDGILDLKTGAGQRNVLKIRQALADSSGLVPPLDVDHVRAQYSGFYSPVEHILSLSASGKLRITKPTLTKMPYRA